MYECTHDEQNALMIKQGESCESWVRTNEIETQEVTVWGSAAAHSFGSLGLLSLSAVGPSGEWSFAHWTGPGDRRKLGDNAAIQQHMSMI